MSSFVKFLIFSFNFLGIASLKFEEKTWKVSKFNVGKNSVQVILFVISEFVFIVFIDLSIFLPEGHSVDDFTSFSIRIFRLIGEIPMFITCFMILNHLRKRKIIPEMCNSFENFHKEFSKFSSCSNFGGNNFIVLLIYMISVRALTFSILVQWNIYVTLSYLLKLYCDICIQMFFFMFVVFVHYLNFITKNFNKTLESVLKSSNNLDALKNCLEFYKRILEIIDAFYKVFHFEVFLILTVLIAKGTMMVSKLKKIDF